MLSKHCSLRKRVLFSFKKGLAIITSRRNPFWYHLEPFFLPLFNQTSVKRVCVGFFSIMYLKKYMIHTYIHLHTYVSYDMNCDTAALVNNNIIFSPLQEQDCHSYLKLGIL